MIPAHGYVKNYDWGRVGTDSYIAKFISQDHDQNKPLAELWFGAHPSGPASVLVDKQLIKLDSFFTKHPEMIGCLDQYYKFNKQLPFLFKILSIQKPLSLQAHPDKKLASILHKKDPGHYPDANHKPELAIALTKFQVLCDFRPHKEILNFISQLKPLRNIIGETNVHNYSTSLKLNDEEKLSIALEKCFKSLMYCEKEIITKNAQDLLKMVEFTPLVEKDLLKLVSKLEKFYPGDPGIFAPFFLNYLKLQPGEAVYLKANKLHAYIEGECIECMACSDNVVRAGLTGKFCDLETLIKMLNYKPINSMNDIIFSGTRNQKLPAITTYAASEEFKVDRINVDSESLLTTRGEFELPSKTSGSFLIVLDGKATANNFFDLSIEHNLSLGSAAFIPPKINLRLQNIQGSLKLYRAFC